MGSAISTTTMPTATQVRVAGVLLDKRTETEVVAHIIARSQAAEGGWVLPVNVDVCRLLRTDTSARDAVANATLIVPDGMPLVWASRLLGQSVAERVAGSALIFSLSAACVSAGRSIYLLGGVPGAADAAAERLMAAYPGLKVAGTDCPPFGFERSSAEVETIRDRLLAAAPDIVFVGLGFPKQERLISILRPELPTSWFVSCGAAIGFAAGTQSQAPDWMRRHGLEWVYRLLIEPQRLAKRYLVHDLPYAAALLTSALLTRVRGQQASGADSRG